MLRRMKPLTPRRHGIVDYAACALMLAAPPLLGLSLAARRTSTLFAGSYLVVTALTDFPLGLRRVIPFPVHGKIELASAPALLALPALLGGLSGTKEKAYFAGLVATVLTAYSLTEWDADPDV
jgi:hypothetical protein